MSESDSKSGSEQPEPSLREGDKVGTFLIRNFLAAGGMGELYRAYDPDLKRYVAIKTLLANPGIVLSDPMFITRFRTEAQAIAGLEHDNVVRVLQFGEMDGNRPYIVMPFLEGEDLDQRLDRAQFTRQPLPINEAVEIILGASRGVHACHLAGVVHRDLKPGNVFLTRDQEFGRLVVKVLDFGVARPTRRDNQESTLNGLVIGTPAYMPPEQALGLPADARSDQYSLGALLYALLTLHRPHDHAGVGLPSRAEAARARLRALREGRAFPPPTQYTPGIPKPLEAAILKALTPAPEGRFDSVYEFSKELEPFASPEVRRYFADYYRAPPRPIIIPQLTLKIPHAPAAEREERPITYQPDGASLGVPAARSDPRSVDISFDTESKKVTVGPRPGHISSVTAVRRPSSKLLRTSKEVTGAAPSPQAHDEAAPTEVRPPPSDVFSLEPPRVRVHAAAVVLPPIIPTPPSLSLLAPADNSSREPSQSEVRTRTSGRRRSSPLFLSITAGVAIIVTMGAVFVLRSSRDNVPSSRIRPPAFLMPVSPPIVPVVPPKPLAVPPALPPKVAPPPPAAPQVPALVEPQRSEAATSPPHRRRMAARDQWWKRTRVTKNGWLVATDPHGRVWTIDEKTGRPLVQLTPDGMPILH